MSREKQVEEMAKAMCGNGMGNGNCAMDDEPCNLECVYGCCAEKLHNAGYRKQIEGEWISNEIGGYKYAFYCSECGWVDGYPFNDRHNYCPNCGARMRKEDEGK